MCLELVAVKWRDARATGKILTATTVQDARDSYDASIFGRRRKSRAGSDGGSAATATASCAGTIALETVIRRTARARAATARARSCLGARGQGGRGGLGRRRCRRRTTTTSSEGAGAFLSNRSYK